MDARAWRAVAISHRDDRDRRHRAGDRAPLLRRRDRGVHRSQRSAARGARIWGLPVTIAVFTLTAYVGAPQFVLILRALSRSGRSRASGLRGSRPSCRAPSPISPAASPARKRASASAARPAGASRASWARTRFARELPGALCADGAVRRRQHGVRRGAREFLALHRRPRGWRAAEDRDLRFRRRRHHGRARGRISARRADGRCRDRAVVAGRRVRAAFHRGHRNSTADPELPLHALARMRATVPGHETASDCARARLCAGRLRRSARRRRIKATARIRNCPRPRSGGPIPTLERGRTLWAGPTTARRLRLPASPSRATPRISRTRAGSTCCRTAMCSSRRAPREPRSGGGIEGWIRNRMQRRAGALGDSANRITLLRDSDGDGDVDARHVFAENLNQPFGMALVGEYFYVANTDAVVRFRYTPDAVRVTGDPETVLSLPHREGDNGHWTRNLAVAPGRIEALRRRRLRHQHRRRRHGGGGRPRGDLGVQSRMAREARIFASGLRNPVGLEFEPHTGALWVAVNERDMLGDNLVPDYMTSVRDGALLRLAVLLLRRSSRRTRRNPRQRPPASADRAGLCARRAHRLAWLALLRRRRLPEHYWNGAFIGQHGSWNRRAPAGYKVVFVPFAERPSRGRRRRLPHRLPE